jgi:hypothetical protein
LFTLNMASTLNGLYSLVRPLLSPLEWEDIR